MILAVAVLLTVGVVVFTLLVRANDIPEEPLTSPVDHLEERKELVYENLRDLQFEFRLGKLSEEDYQKSKLELQKELARVMAQIDAAGGVRSPKPAPKPAPKPTPEPTAKPDEPTPSGACVCPHCGAEFAQAMRFCGSCGKPMEGAVT